MISGSTRPTAHLLKQYEAKVTITDMSRTVKDVWNKVDNGRDQVELSKYDVANLFAYDWKVVADQSSALKFISKTANSPGLMLTWDEFNRIFVKGIFK
jgi:hypothetical protein